MDAPQLPDGISERDESQGKDQDQEITSTTTAPCDNILPAPYNFWLSGISIYASDSPRNAIPEPNCSGCQRLTNRLMELENQLERATENLDRALKPNLFLSEAVHAMSRALSSPVNSSGAPRSPGPAPPN